MKWLLSAIAHAVSGQLLGEDKTIDGISSDTRSITTDQLFVALRGERFDAHDFLETAANAGAAAFLVSDPSRLPDGASAVAVDDTRLALGRLATAWRGRFDLPLIALTGSNGKTTTKEMIAAILRTHYGESAVLATQGNLNNDIGLPLTLLGLEDTQQAAVVEMGMNHPGEIAYLTHIARPTVALVTNAQRAHLLGLGTVADVATEKGSIFAGLEKDGTAVINVDDPHAASWLEMAADHPCLSVGLDHPADVQGEVHLRGLRTQMSLHTPWGDGEFTLHMPGQHNARNALLAAAATLAAGIPLAQVLAGLESFCGVPGRLHQRHGLYGACVLDDSYNANPDSFRAGIDVLAQTIGHTILVMGDMGEVGRGSAQYHDEIGGYAKSQGIDRLFALGEHSQLAARNFGDGGQYFGNVHDLISQLKKELTPETTVLVKGSRFMRMERVVEAITDLKEKS